MDRSQRADVARAGTSVSRRALNQVATFQYVTVENAPTYRAIMQVFFEARQRYVIELRSRDLLEQLAASSHHFELADDDALDRHLAQLVSWGNLAHAHDPGAVSRLEDFYKKRFVYHLTLAGEAAHKAVLEVEATVGRSGSLQSTMLAKIRDTLVRLAHEGGLLSPSPDALFGLIHDLHSAFGTLTAEANQFIAEIDRSDSEPAAEERFVQHKNALLAYVSRFIEQLRRLSEEIRDAIALVDAIGPARLIDLASRSSDLPPSLGLTDPAERWRQEQEDRWAGVRAWFEGDRSTQSSAVVDRLAQVARDAVIALTRTLVRINERRTRPVDRAADFGALARWFSGCTDDGEAHRLWRSAFGLSAARHFDLADADAELTPAGVSWWDAPPVEVPIRLRSHGAPSTAGRPAAAADHTLARRTIEQRRRREQALLQESIRRFAGRGPFTIASLGELTAAELDTLMAFIDDALGSPREADGARVVRSSDGRFRITLEPPRIEPDAIVSVDVATGWLWCRDYRIHVEDSLAPVGVERLEVAR